MNTLIANQYGRVQGETGGCMLTLCGKAQTLRRELVELQTRSTRLNMILAVVRILKSKQNDPVDHSH